MGIKPQTIANSLIERLTHFAQGSNKPDDLTMLRFKSEADKLAKAALAESAMAKGIIACLEGDLAECKRQHELSIQLEANPVHYLNYAQSLRKFGKIADAYQFVKIAIGLRPMDAYFICSGIVFSLQAGHPDQALSYFQAYQKLNLSSTPPVIEQYVAESEMIISMNLPNNAFSEAALLLAAIISDHKVQPKESSFFKIEAELFQWLETTADVNTTVDMNFQLAEKLAERKDLNLGGLTVAFRASQ